MIDENEFSDHESQSATWIALADLMTGLMAIFLVLCILMLTNQDRTRVMIIQSIQESMKAEGIRSSRLIPIQAISVLLRIYYFLTVLHRLSAQGKVFFK